MLLIMLIMVDVSTARKSYMSIVSSSASSWHAFIVIGTEGNTQKHVLNALRLATLVICGAPKFPVKSLHALTQVKS